MDADHGAAVEAVDLNLARHQLTDAQKVLLGRQIEPDVAVPSAEREAHWQTAPGRSVTTVTEVIRTTDEFARIVGLGVEPAAVLDAYIPATDKH